MEDSCRSRIRWADAEAQEIVGGFSRRRCGNFSIFRFRFSLPWQHELPAEDVVEERVQAVVRVLALPGHDVSFHT